MSYQDDPDARAEAQQYRENRREMFNQLEEKRVEQRWWDEHDKKKAELPPLDFTPDPMHSGNMTRIIDCRERQLREALALAKRLKQERDSFATACNVNKQGVEVISEWIGYYNEKKNECEALKEEVTRASELCASANDHLPGSPTLEDHIQELIRGRASFRDMWLRGAQEISELEDQLANARKDGLE